MRDTRRSFASGCMVTPQCSLGQNKWTLSEAEARGEQRMRADALREEGGRGRKWERYIICTSAMAPISCLFTWIFIFCTLPFLHQSIHLSFYLTPLHTYTHSYSHTLHSTDGLDIPCDHLPLTPLPPLSLAFQHKTPDIMWQVSAQSHTVSPEAWWERVPYKDS